MRLRVLGVVALAIHIGFAALVWAQGSPRVVHVFVALADNINQGIVPVPAKLGSGLDSQHNLYWGRSRRQNLFCAQQGLAAGFTKPGPKPEILERCVFKHRTANVYLVADAYRGDRIQLAITEFLDAAAGANAEEVNLRAGAIAASIPAGGGADLVAYMGP